MNRINKTFINKKNILSIYFTAGFPKLQDTMSIIKELNNSGVDMIEIGLPFSDPLADGPTIQESSTIALSNGMNTNILFDQIKDLRSVTELPVIIMGYLNPIIQYGIEEFCLKCKECQIDGLIIPDLPVDVYADEYKAIFEKYGLKNIFLITPQTSDERIHFIDSVSDGFIYMVSSASVTGSSAGFGNTQEAYFQRIVQMNLKNPQVIGFGINNAETFQQATQFAKGAIIGSAFITYLKENGTANIKAFVESIR